MTIPPMSEADLWDLINEAEARMTPAQAGMWEAIRILPEKWQQHPYGNESGGFWAVGLFGRWVLWFNEIEEGFNLSAYKRYGVIDEYFCNQDELEWAIQNVLRLIELGHGAGPRKGPPKPLEGIEG